MNSVNVQDEKFYSGKSMSKWWRRAGLRAANVSLGLIIPSVILTVWLLDGFFHWLPSALIPTPREIFIALEVWSGHGAERYHQLFYWNMLASDTSITLIRLSIGFVLAVFIGVGSGIAIGMSPFADNLLTPTFRVLGPIPPITIFPLAIILLGLGSQTNIFLTFYGAFFPIMAASATAVASVPRDFLRAGRMLGYSGFHRIILVVLPSALPAIIGSIRLGLGLAWMMEVTSEMMGVHSGLGYTMWNAYNYFDYSEVYAAMLVIGSCGFASDYIVRLITKKSVAWHEQTGVRGS
ncbi:ABC transporter permease [Acidithiobacillus sp. IBUN Pt1247-S3]